MCAPGSIASHGAQSVVVATEADEATGVPRVAIVTGGSRGIGREVTRRLAGKGYALVVYYARNQEAAETAVEEVLAANGTAIAVRGDVADELDVERLFAETIDAFGHVDVVVHAVGQLILGPVAHDDLDGFDALLRTNVRGTFVVNRQAALELRDGGAIINIFGSLVGQAFPTRAAYAASKGAVAAITRVLADDLRGRDISVNAIAAEVDRPGIVAPEIANVVAFLVSEAGHEVNGQVIRPNGEA